jgi:hypothetical protein
MGAGTMAGIKIVQRERPPAAKKIAAEAAPDCSHHQAGSRKMLWNSVKCTKEY